MGEMFKEQKEIVGEEADRMLDRLQHKVERNLYTEDIATATIDFVAKSIKAAREKLNLNTAGVSDIANFTNPFEAWKEGSEFTVEGLVKMRSFQGDPGSNISPSLARFCRQMWRTEMVSWVMREIPKTARTDQAVVMEKVLAAQIVPEGDRTPAKMLVSAMYLDDTLSSRPERARLAQKMASEGEDGITLGNLSEKFSGFTPTSGVQVLVGGEFITFSKELADSLKFRKVIQDGNRIYGLMANGCEGNLVIIEGTGGGEGKKVKRREAGPATTAPWGEGAPKERAPGEPAPPAEEPPAAAPPAPVPPAEPAPAPAPPAPAPAPSVPAPAAPAPPAPAPPLPGTGGSAGVRERAEQAEDEKLSPAAQETLRTLRTASGIQDNITYRSGGTFYHVTRMHAYRLTVDDIAPNRPYIIVTDPIYSPGQSGYRRKKVWIFIDMSDPLALDPKDINAKIRKALKDTFNYELPVKRPSPTPSPRGDTRGARAAEISLETYAWGREFDARQHDIFSKLQSTQLWKDKRIEITNDGLVYNMKGERDDTYKIDLLRSDEYDFSIDVVVAGSGKREKIYFRLDNSDHVDPAKVDKRILDKLVELGDKQTA